MRFYLRARGCWRHCAAVDESETDAVLLCELQHRSSCCCIILVLTVVHQLYWQLASDVWVTKKREERVGVAKLAAATSNDQDPAAGWLLSGVSILLMLSNAASCCSRRACGVERLSQLL